MMKVSIITASWNSGRTIGDTLHSVAAQTYPAIEHIVVDGGSTDETMAVIERDGSHVACALSEPDAGIYDAFNKGLKLATGEIIGFLNSDDFYCSTDVISLVMAVFENPEVEGVHADLVYVDANDPSKVRRHWKGWDFTPEDYRRGFIPAHPTVFLRRSVYDRVGGYDTAFKLAADYDFLLRAFCVHRIRAVHLPRILLRMRAGGATGGTAASIKRQNDEIRASREAHGLRYPNSLFFTNKLINRSLQIARAPFVRMPGGIAR